jgi:hypothetical protein
MLFPKIIRLAERIRIWTRNFIFVGTASGSKRNHLLGVDNPTP